MSEFGDHRDKPIIRSYVDQTGEDPFEIHPLRQHFINTAVTTLDETGRAQLPETRIRAMAEQIGLGVGEVAALAYMSGHRADDIVAEQKAIIVQGKRRFWGRA